jgi:hypothetical protein
MCRSAQNVLRNDRTRPQADRNGCVWERHEEQFIRDNLHLSDTEIALELKRTMKSVIRRRLFYLGLNKNGKAAPPKPLYNEFVHHYNDLIKQVSVIADGNKITVWSNTNTLWVNIHKAFIAQGFTDEDYKAWKIGVTA